MNHGEKESARAHGWRELVNVGIGFRIIDTEGAVRTFTVVYIHTMKLDIPPKFRTAVQRVSMDKI